MARFARGAEKLLIVKTDRNALVHRSGAMDCVIVKTHDRDGRVTGERRLVGFFTSAAYHAMAQHVPLLRARVAGVGEVAHEALAVVEVAALEAKRAK